MHQLSFRERETPESVYAARYDWLLRWAMHFCKNDRHEAEDLVQDVFMQLLVSWASVRDSDHPEKFLYTYLKYGYLMSCRRKRRYSFQTLSVVDFESLHLSLRSSGKDSDPVELQDQLRRIAAYLNWRKLSAKSASILLLRFFHGFFPTEIMHVGLLTRRAVDRGLALAREEVKAYLTTPDRLHIMQHGAPPSLPGVHIALPAVEFEQALRNSIFEARAGECLPADAMETRYSLGTPIDCELLAHIVSCERCLNLVCKSSGLSSHSERSLYEASGAGQREKPQHRAIACSAKSETSIRKGHERFREAYEHRPKALVVAVDGEVLAARDINSKVNELKVEMTRAVPTELIEIMSEQELPLLTLPILGSPPELPPSLNQTALLANGRSVNLQVTFTASGALIEVTYCDPHFEALDETVQAELLVLKTANAQLGIDEEPATEPDLAKTSRWKHIIEYFRTLARGARHPHVLAAVMASVLLITGALFVLHKPASVKPEGLLAKAVAAETALPSKASAGVIHQKVRIVTRHQSMERDLYRDQVHHAHPRRKQPTTDESALESTLTLANIGWNDPLSPITFRDWHDHADVVQDTVKHTNENLLTLTTTVRGGPIAKESLTLRESDLHAVERTVELRNDEHIEIAELEYEVLPWSKVNPEWFESQAPFPANSSPRAALPLQHASIALSEGGLNEAELHTRLVLGDLSDDVTQRLTIERTPHGIQVRGIVPDRAQKDVLSERLSGVPHVSTQVRTFREWASQPAPANPVGRITVASKEPAPSPLETLLESKGVSAQSAAEISHRIFESSSEIERSSLALAEFQRRFRSSALTPEGERFLQTLEEREQSRLKASIASEKQALDQIVRESGTGWSPTRDSEHSNRGWVQEIHVNAELCRELISESSAGSRPTLDMLKEIAASLASLEQLVNEYQPAAVSANSALPPHIGAQK